MWELLIRLFVCWSAVRKMRWRRASSLVYTQRFLPFRLHACFFHDSWFFCCFVSFHFKPAPKDGTAIITVASSQIFSFASVKESLESKGKRDWREKKKTHKLKPSSHSARWHIGPSDGSAHCILHLLIIVDCASSAAFITMPAAETVIHHSWKANLLPDFVRSILI